MIQKWCCSEAKPASHSMLPGPRLLHEGSDTTTESQGRAPERSERDPSQHCRPSILLDARHSQSARLHPRTASAKSLRGKDSSQANRQISTGKLNTLLHLHFRPINLVVFEVPHGISSFEEGFTLICFQRLSFPNVATLQCPGRDNRNTRGSSDPILSY